MKHTDNLILFSLAVLCAIKLWRLFLNNFDPFFYHSVEVVTPQVKRGGIFVEKLDVQRYRICRVEIDRYMVSERTKEVIYRKRVPGGATAIGRTRDVRNTINIPLDAPVGPVLLLQNAHSNCIDGTHSMQWPPLRFEIIE